MGRFKSCPQSYLVSANMTVNEIHMLCNLRTYMLPEAKANYKQQFGENIWCSSCQLFPASQEHIFSCFVIRDKLKHDVNFNEYSYDDISGSLDKQEKIAKLFIKIREVIMKLKEEGLNPSPSSRKDQSTEDLDSSSGSDILDAAVF